MTLNFYNMLTARSPRTTVGIGTERQSAELRRRLVRSWSTATCGCSIPMAVAPNVLCELGTRARQSALQTEGGGNQKTLEGEDTDL